MKNFDFPYINDSPVEDNWREGAPRIRTCDQCGKEAETHKVKYADETGCGSMDVCDECDDSTPATTGVQVEICDKCGWAIDEDNNNHKADCSNASPTTGVHTATPWAITNTGAIHSGEGFNIGEVYDANPKDGNDEQIANAAFIVRAVNSHDKLVAALREIAGAGSEWVADFDSIVKIARAALTEVEK